MSKQKFIPYKFAKEELLNLEKLEKLLRYWLKFLVETGSTAYGCFVDTLGSNTTGGTIAIEMKNRKPNTLDYPDIMIEPEKLDRLIWLWEEKRMWVYYINFFGDIALIYSVPAISDLKDTFRFKENMRIHFTGETGEILTKYEDRYFIPINLAYKVDINTGEVLEKPEKKQKSVPAPLAYDFDFSKEITSSEIENANEQKTKNNCQADPQPKPCSGRTYESPEYKCKHTDKNNSRKLACTE